MIEEKKEVVDNGKEFGAHLFALITYYYLQNFMVMECHIHRLS